MTCFAQYLCIYIVLSPSDSLQGKGVADRPTGESDALVKEEDRLDCSLQAGILFYQRAAITNDKLVPY